MRHVYPHAVFGRGGSARLIQQMAQHRRIVLNYLVAVVAVGLAFAGRLALEPVLDGQARFLFCIPAVLIASAIGGIGPGIFATALSMAVGLFHFGQTGLTPGIEFNAIAFAVIGIGIAAFGEFLHRSRRRMTEAVREVIAREAHLASILNTVPDAMIVIDVRGIV